jgi:hypothetical protein
MLHYLNAITENLASDFFRPRDVLGPNRSWLKEGGGRVMSHRNCDPPPEVLRSGTGLERPLANLLVQRSVCNLRPPHPSKRGGRAGTAGLRILPQLLSLGSLRIAGFAFGLLTGLASRTSLRSGRREPSPRGGLHNGEALYATRYHGSETRGVTSPDRSLLSPCGVLLMPRVPYDFSVRTNQAGKPALINTSLSDNFYIGF